MTAALLEAVDRTRRATGHVARTGSRRGRHDSGALNALIARTTHPGDKGKAGGIYMAGNVGGTASSERSPLALDRRGSLGRGHGARPGRPRLRGGSGHRPREALLRDAATRPLGVLRALGRRIAEMGRDLWETASSLDGFTALVISLAPVGCGALTNLFAGMAIEFGADQRVVEVVNGLGGGMAGALGSLVGGFLADRMNRRVAYALAGGLTALSALGMLGARHDPHDLHGGDARLQLCQRHRLRDLGRDDPGGRRPHRRGRDEVRALRASSNFAVATVTKMDGWASGVRGFRRRTREAGARGALAFDAGITAVGIVIVLGLVRYTSWRKARISAATAAGS